MTPPTPNAQSALMFCAAVLVLAALLLSVLGLRRPRYAGVQVWVGALWAAAAGGLLAVVAPQGWGTAAADALLLAWPVGVLVGMRRFRPRQGWPGSVKADLLLLAAGVAAVLVDAALAMGAVPPLATFFWTDTHAPGPLAAAAALGVHLGVATVLLRAASGVLRRPVADDVPLLALATVLVLTALAPGIFAQAPAEPLGSLAGRSVAAALGAVAVACLALTMIHDRTAQRLRQSRQRLRELANLDPLTEVPNRRHFAELAGQALRQSRPGSAVLLIFDVDHFKHINDRQGHAAGDRALRLVAQSMVEHLRAEDVAGRHGGDEFVLLLREAATADAMRVAARIVAAVQRRSGPLQLPALSLSFGMVQVGPAEPLGDALRRADQALYEAKRQGRSRAVAALGDEERPVFAESQRLGLLPH